MRVIVTYLFAFAYVAAAGYIIFAFIDSGNTEAALATFSGLGTFASAVVGFIVSRATEQSFLRPHCKGRRRLSISPARCRTAV